MRNNDPIFWPDTTLDQNLKQQREKNYSDCINVLQTQWYQADLDDRFNMGDQDLWGLIFPGVATYRRKIFNFNLIHRAIQMVTGYQRRNRKSTICIPIRSPMQKTADQLSKCLFHVHDRAGAYQTYSDAFEQGALVKGIGLTAIFKDTTCDPVSGDIRLRNIDFRSVLIDPFFRRHDLSDCRFIWTRQFLDRKDAATLYPQYADEIMGLPGGTYRDDKFYYMPEVYQIQVSNMIAFDEYWYQSSREATFLVDIETEETQEWEGTEEQLDRAMRLYGDGLRVIKQPKPTTRRTIVLNDRTMIDEPNPYGMDRYPFAVCLGYMNADTPYYAYKFRGIVRDMRDAQYLFNRRKVTDLDILESQQQGLKVKKGALVTPEDSLNQGNGRVLTIDPSYQMDDVQPMPIIPPAPTMIQMEEALKSVMMEISGVNEELLGAAVDDKAGVLSMLRQGAGLTTLQKLFDQFDEYQRNCGDIIVEMIQKNWTYGKVKQVIGEDPTSEFSNKLFFKYGCKVVPGVLTETQQQLQLQQLLYLRETTGIPVPSKTILEACTLQNKDELIKAVMEQEQQQQQQQQQMAQLQMQNLMVDNKTKLAYANSQDSLAQERKAKISTDMAVNMEKIQRSKEERSSALLNVIKAIKELQGIDLDMIEKGLAIVSQVNEINQLQNPGGENERIHEQNGVPSGQHVA